MSKHTVFVEAPPFAKFSDAEMRRLLDDERLEVLDWRGKRVNTPGFVEALATADIAVTGNSLTITDELLDTMACEEKIVKYMDIPLQHASGKILRAMNRRGDRESLTSLMKRIREKVPGVILRTTLITGFPGETNEDFTELMEFVKEVRFDRLGCFAYSQEEDTPAAELPDQIDEDVKERRAEIVMQDQMEIMEEQGQRLVGQTLEVLVEGFDRYAECWFGRSAMDAPDIDGKVFFSVSEKKPVLGSFVKVEIEDCMDCDLTGHLVP